MSKMRYGLSKKHISRVILTDTLPYELPMYFSNYRLFAKMSSSEKAHKLVEQVLAHSVETMPCKFYISKRPEGFRELTLMHPGAQCSVVDLYRNYDGFISQLCSRSRFSLRYPLRPASRFFESRYKDEEGDNVVEMDEVGFDSQSEFASSYFAYRRYSQIYKFFDSEEFIRLEQRFACLLRIDISKCFSSIYTHSISWAVRGKNFAKDEKSSKSVVYFESAFDNLMRNANWGETNGIVIGPEVSRIFCEIVLQGVDSRIEGRIGNNVELRRYMDDYFIFANSADDAKAVESIVSEELAFFNLHLNEGKRKLEFRPLVSSLSIARLEVNELCADLALGLNELVIPASQDETGEEFVRLESSSDKRSAKGQGADKIIRSIRAIARLHGVDYSGLAAPALAVIGRKLNSTYSKISASGMRQDVDVAKVQRYLSKVIRVAEFLYITDVRSSTSNKIARVFLEVAAICEVGKLGRSFVELQMLDVVRKAMSIWRGATMLDIVNAAVAAQLVSSGGRGLDPVDVTNVLARQSSPSRYGAVYLRTVLGLFLCGKRKSLEKIKDKLTRDAIDLLSAPGAIDLSNSSIAYLLLDILNCPFIEVSIRADLYQLVALQLFSKNAISKADAKGEITRLSKSVYFTEWSVTSGDLRQLRGLLRKNELRLAYD